MSMSGEKSIVKPFYLFVACHESRHRLVNFSFQRETWGGIEVSTLNNEDEADSRSVDPCVDPKIIRNE